MGFSACCPLVGTLSVDYVLSVGYANCYGSRGLFCSLLLAEFVCGELEVIIFLTSLVRVPALRYYSISGTVLISLIGRVLRTVFQLGVLFCATVEVISIPVIMYRFIDTYRYFWLKTLPVLRVYRNTHRSSHLLPASAETRQLTLAIANIPPDNDSLALVAALRVLYSEMYEGMSKWIFCFEYGCLEAIETTLS